MNSLWPLSRELLNEILADHISDNFVCHLVWERLDYVEMTKGSGVFFPGITTPKYWSEKFPNAPQFIVKRSAAVHLTRAIPKEHKQALKSLLAFWEYYYLIMHY